MDMRDDDILDFIFGENNGSYQPIKTVVNENTYVLDQEKLWLLDCVLISY